MLACSPAVLLSALDDLLDHDSARAAAACKVPTLYVSSGPWYTDVTRFKQLCPTLSTAQLVGCGHYFPMEIPDQAWPYLWRELAPARNALAARRSRSSMRPVSAQARAALPQSETYGG